VPSTRLALLCAALAAFVLVGGALVAPWGGAQPAPAAPLVDAGPRREPDPPRARPRHAEAVPPVASPVAVDEALSARVDRLARSDDPVAAFAAYRLVTDCLWARDHAEWLASHVEPADRALLPTPQGACGDIASDQIQSRLRWLERAAAAGVHHAATAMSREGPDGLGLVAEADLAGPQFADWRQRLAAAYDAGVRTCDPESLEQRMAAFDGGLGVEQDRARALSYWVAYVDCRRRFGAPALAPADGDGVALRMGSALGAGQVDAATAAGHRLAREARPLPGDS